MRVKLLMTERKHRKRNEIFCHISLKDILRVLKLMSHKMPPAHLPSTCPSSRLQPTCAPVPRGQMCPPLAMGFHGGRAFFLIPHITALGDRDGVSDPCTGV